MRSWSSRLELDLKHQIQDGASDIIFFNRSIFFLSMDIYLQVHSYTGK